MNPGFMARREGLKAMLERREVVKPGRDAVVAAARAGAAAALEAGLYAEVKQFLAIIELAETVGA